MAKKYFTGSNIQRLPVQLALMVIALLLNMSGAVISKYILLTIQAQVLLGMGLLALLALNYLGRVFFWIEAGRRFQLSYIYPMLSLNYFFSFILGMVLFHETFEWNHLIGSLIIVAGVAYLSITDHQTEGTRDV